MKLVSGKHTRAQLAATLAIAVVIVLASTETQLKTAEPKRVDSLFFLGELNRFAGSGGEILINRVLSEDDASTPGKDQDGQLGDPDSNGPIPEHVIQRLDVGDRLAGIGIAHLVESLSHPPGPSTFHAAGDNKKNAARVFQVKTKQATANGFSFTFSPLSPDEFSATVAELSSGAVKIAAATIPVGTMVLSFDDPTPDYTLEKVSGSPAKNWVEATNGARHWNIGVATPDDFWMATFPSDDLGLLPLMEPTSTIGTIKFGLSLLAGSKGMTNLQHVQCTGPSGKATKHHFCLSGAATGTRGFATPFPIGLRTEILFNPMP